MTEFSGVRVVLKDGATRNFLPGVEHPGVLRYCGSREGAWYVVRAIMPASGGYEAAIFPESAVLFAEPLK